MNKRILQYIPIREISPDQAKESQARIGTPNELELEVSYSLGGTNCFTGAISPRGYYLTATPVERNKRDAYSTISFAIGTGVKAILLEVNRQSDKQKSIACTLAAEAAPKLMKWCEQEYDIFCDMPEEFFPNAVKLPVPKVLPKPVPKEKPQSPIKPIRGMKLLTAEVIRKLEKHPFGSQASKGDNAQVLVKFFGGSSYTFLVTEGQRMKNGDWHLYGKATTGFDWEWGYAFLSEIENLKFPPFGLGVERDMYLDSHATVGKLSA